MKPGEVKEENIQCSVFFNAVYSSIRCPADNPFTCML